MQEAVRRTGEQIIADAKRRGELPLPPDQTFPDPVGWERALDRAILLGPDAAPDLRSASGARVHLVPAGVGQVDHLPIIHRDGKDWAVVGTDPAGTGVYAADPDALTAWRDTPTAPRTTATPNNAQSENQSGEQDMTDHDQSEDTDTREQGMAPGAVWHDGLGQVAPPPHPDRLQLHVREQWEADRLHLVPHGDVSGLGRVLGYLEPPLVGDDHAPVVVWRQATREDTKPEHTPGWSIPVAMVRTLADALEQWLGADSTPSQVADLEGAVARLTADRDTARSDALVAAMGRDKAEALLEVETFRRLEQEDHRESVQAHLHDMIGVATEHRTRLEALETPARWVTGVEGTTDLEPVNTMTMLTAEPDVPLARQLLGERDAARKAPEVERTAGRAAGEALALAQAKVETLEASLADERRTTFMVRGMTEATKDMLRERERQVAKGWTPRHDDGHRNSDMVRLIHERLPDVGRTYRDSEAEREAMVKVAALAVAAVEAADRRMGRPSTAVENHVENGSGEQSDTPPDRITAEWLDAHPEVEAVLDRDGDRWARHDGDEWELEDNGLRRPTHVLVLPPAESRGNGYGPVTLP